MSYFFYSSEEKENNKAVKPSSFPPVAEALLSVGFQDKVVLL